MESLYTETPEYRKDIASWHSQYVISNGITSWELLMEALKGHVKFLKQFVYLLIRTYISPNYDLRIS